MARAKRTLRALCGRRGVKASIGGWKKHRNDVLYREDSITSTRAPDEPGFSAQAHHAGSISQADIGSVLPRQRATGKGKLAGLGTDRN